MKYLLSISIVLTLHLKVLSQDSLVASSCNCLDKVLNGSVNKVEFQFAHEDCFNEVYSKLISLSSTDSSDVQYERFMSDLEMNCDAYNKCHEILDKMTLEKSHIKIQNKESCKQTMKIGEFEDRSGNEIVLMSMKDSIQLVTFGDNGPYTKSKVEWIDECTYKVIFIESTNPFENGVLKKGDEREVRIIDIKADGEVIYEVGMYDRWFLGRVKKIR